MRVIAGSARSIPLKAPKGMKTRPTIDKHKETLFNCLSDRLYGCTFVDFFSGTGAIGIEALSRGAKTAFFVENDREALSVIKENLTKTKLSDKAVILSRSVESAVRSGRIKNADIIFMDPPFELHLEKEVIPMIPEQGILAEDGIIVVECLSDTDFSYLEGLGLEIFKEKDYKTCKHVFISKT